MTPARAWSLVSWMAVLAMSACSGPAGPPSGEGASPSMDGDVVAQGSDGPSLVVPEEFAERWTPWTGDLDGMVERRIVRILVAYNSTNYFVDLGKQGGLAYEAGRLLEKEMNRRFKTGNLPIDVVFFPVVRDQLLPALVEGHGDIAVGSLTITEGRLETVAFSEPLARGVNEIVVTGPGAPDLDSLDDLAGREVHVRASSSYYESLQGLNASLAKRGLDPVEIAPVDERLETEDILEMTNAGVFPITVADDFLANLWAQSFEGITLHPDLAVREGTEIAWAIRKDGPRLEAFLDEFVKKNRQGTLTGNILIKRYYRNADWIKNPGTARDAERFRSMVALFRKYAERYGLDYLLVTAQAYQESGLDQSVRSRAGAVGVMQLLPSTARDKNVGIPHIEVLENNIHAGVKYLRFILDRYYADAEMDEVDQHLFAFASYNAGPARIAGLRSKAAAMGLDPNRWRGQVEVVAAKEIGRETVTYVANILKYYLAYRLIEERQAGRDRAKKQA
jgi:membrane-bound lytic murein transglycosylase MltF